MTLFKWIHTATDTVKVILTHPKQTKVTMQTVKCLGKKCRWIVRVEASVKRKKVKQSHYRPGEALRVPAG